MFGERHKPPRPPSYEPWLVLLLAVLIAVLVTALYGGFIFLTQGPASF
jgi:hypothetical protein